MAHSISFIGTLTVTSLLLCAPVTDGAKLPHEWTVILQAASLEFERAILHSVASAQHLHVIPSVVGSGSGTSYLILPVIFWSPVEQYPAKLPSITCTCTTSSGNRQLEICGSTLNACDWNCGQNDKRQPRLLYCFKTNVILVSRVYKCENGHEISGHHPDIVNLFDSPSLRGLLPFRLWHRVGFTSKCITNLHNLINCGIFIQKLETMLKQNRIENFYCRKEQFFQLGVGGEFPTINDNTQQIITWLMSPSRHAISNCYLYRFEECQKVYRERMACTSVSEECCWVSCDHTFSSVANIGITRTQDKKWATQYTGLFCVLNENGEVLTWKLTKDLTFDAVKEQLTALHDRLNRQGKVLNEFFVDNCCAWRNKLQGIFGDTLNVYLDVFHAVQRICTKIPKRHLYHAMCMKDLRLVFRDPSDRGKERSKPTPAPEVLKQQLSSFVDTWKSLSANGRQILPPAAITKVNSLMKHIEKGCLSGIQPGRGTNHNERLHKDLNTVMRNNKYGVELANALLTETFYRHNEHIQAKLQKRLELPINAYFAITDCNTDDHGENFGLLTKDDSSRILHSDGQLQFDHEVAQQLDLKDATLLDIQHCMLQALDKIQSTGESTLDTTAHDNHCITKEEAISILRQSCEQYIILRNIKTLSKSGTLDCDNIAFLSFLVSIQGLKSIPSFTIGTQSSSNNLQAVLTAWNFQRITVPGDGNCLFTSVASAILHRIGKGDASLATILNKIGICDWRDVTTLAESLRQCMVKEWIGENYDLYQSFVTVDLREEGHCFTHDGQFSGEVGDLMVFTLSNILQTPITIFTSIPNIPLICITPTFVSTLSETPLFLTFIQEGPGHYDYAVINNPDISTQSEQSDKSSKCYCGRKKDFQGQSCSPAENGCSRCPCIRLENPCTSQCKCKNCNNPHGIRQIIATRTRKQYHVQRQSLCGKPGPLFMVQSCEKITHGTLSELELLILKCTTIYFILHGIDLLPQNLLNTHQLIYNIALSYCSGIIFSIFPRKIEGIHAFLKKILVQIELFKKMYGSE